MSLYHIELYDDASHITRNEPGDIATTNYVITIAGGGHGVIVEAINSVDALEKGILAIQKYKALKQYIDIVFDGPPGPVCGRFIDVEDADGKSINLGEWIRRKDGYCVLRIPKNINLG